MATITLTRTFECTAQNHIVIAVTGDVAYTYHGKDTFIKVLLRTAKIGRTKAQIRTALGAGYAVTI